MAAKNQKKTPEVLTGSACKTITPARISQIALGAYKACGYRTVSFPDGSVGVLKCAPKTILLMNTFQALLMDEVDPPPMGDPDLNGGAR